MWKHFHVQATAWPAGGVTRRFGIKPGAEPLKIGRVADLDELIGTWAGGLGRLFDARTGNTSAGPVPMVSHQSDLKSSASTFAGSSSNPMSPIYIIAVKDPFAWVASMLGPGMANFILRTEYNLLPAAVDPTSTFHRYTNFPYSECKYPRVECEPPLV